MALNDSYGRTINYLRLSITDSCNLRCLYCVPDCSYASTSVDDLLSFDDFYRIAAAAVAIGVEKIRITGGEPLCRTGIVGFIARLKELSGLKKIVLTTNGILLESMASELRRAGVDSLNISLDSLVCEKFGSITRGGDLARVLGGVRAAEEAGFTGIKLNVVMMRGVNDDELFDFVSLTLDRPFKVRFIEYMPTVSGDGTSSYVITGRELMERIASRFELEPVPRQNLDGPAVYYRIRGAAGEVGFITPVSCHFCDQCNRIRVTSRGTVKGCLFDEGVLDLRPLLADESLLVGALERVAGTKPRTRNLLGDQGGGIPLEMARIGG